MRDAEAWRRVVLVTNRPAAGRHPLPTVLHGLIDDLDEILADEGLLP